MATDDYTFDPANATDEDYQRELRRQLLGKMQGFQRGMEADDRFGREQGRDDTSTARQLAAAAAYNKAFAQMGAIGGKVADSSPVTDYTNELIKNQQNAATMGENQQDHREKLNQYLMGKMLEQEGAVGKLRQNKEEAATNAQIRKEDLERKNARDAAEDKLKKQELAIKDKEANAKIALENKKSDEEKALKPDQSNAAVYGRRLEQAEEDFNNVAKSGWDPTSNKAAAWRMAPGITEGLKPEPAKLQEQAERNFVNAVLRRESGSAISKSEFDSAEKQYFPRAGDTDAVKNQKQRNRQIALNGLKAAAGPAWDKVQLPPAIAVAPPKPEEGTATAATLSDQDKAALDWANKNPSDPRSSAILKKLGRK